MERQQTQRIELRWRCGRYTRRCHLSLLLRSQLHHLANDQLPKAALLAGVLTSTGSWPTILPSGMPSPWPVRTSWYCGIILSLLSIISAADQTVRLHRLSSHRDGLPNIRKLLAKGSRTTKTGRRAPSLTQIMAWQTPVMFLITATICMVVGMFLLVWSATANVISPGLWDDQLKVWYPVTCIEIISIC
jgi:hypothetical protein